MHKDIIRVLSAMFVKSKQMPHQLVDIKKLMMFLGSALKTAGPIDGDLPPAHPPGIPAPPPELHELLRGLPPADDMPNDPMTLTESEKACLQEYLRELISDFSTDKCKKLYTRLSESDRYNSGHLSYKNMVTVFEQFGVSGKIC